MNRRGFLQSLVGSLVLTTGALRGFSAKPRVDWRGRNYDFDATKLGRALADKETSAWDRIFAEAVLEVYETRTPNLGRLP